MSKSNMIPFTEDIHGVSESIYTCYIIYIDLHKQVNNNLHYMCWNIYEQDLKSLLNNVFSGLNNYLISNKNLQVDRSNVDFPYHSFINNFKFLY